MAKHVADGEAQFVVINISPDICKVNNAFVPFEIVQYLSAEKAEYAEKTRARGEKVLRVGSVVGGTIGNQGKGVLSGVSIGGGDSVMTEGDATILVKGQPIVRHLDPCVMNVAG